MSRGSGSREAESVREGEKRVREPSPRPGGRVGVSGTRAQSQVPHMSVLGHLLFWGGGVETTY